MRDLPWTTGSWRRCSGRCDGQCWPHRIRRVRLEIGTASQLLRGDRFGYANLGSRGELRLVSMETERTPTCEKAFSFSITGDIDLRETKPVAHVSMKVDWAAQATLSHGK